jgi:putative transposase
LAVTHKRIYRLYAKEGPSTRTKLPRRERPSATAKLSRGRWQRIYGQWTSCQDQLFDRRLILIYTVLEIHTRVGLSIHLKGEFLAAQVVEVLDQLGRARGEPKSARLADQSEFPSLLLDHRAYLNGVKVDFP